MEIILLIFIFALKIHFYVKMKIKDIISNGFDFDKRYPECDPAQLQEAVGHLE